MFVGLKLLNIFAKNFILDVWQGTKDISDFKTA